MDVRISEILTYNFYSVSEKIINDDEQFYMIQL